MINEQADRLSKAGYGLFIFGHTKYKTVKDKITGEEYEQLTSSLTEDLDAIFGDSVQVVATISIDKMIEDGKLVGTKRMIHFRDNGLVNCGCRFKGMPDSVELSAKNYLEAFRIGVKNSFLTPKSDSEIADMQAKEVAEREENVQQTIQNDPVNLSKKVVALIKAAQKDGKTNKEIMGCLTSVGIKSPSEVENIDQFTGIVAEFKKLGVVISE